MESILRILCISFFFQGSISSPTEDLYDQNLTTIPSNLDPDTEHLIVNKNQITELANLENYPNLTYLLMNQNHLATVDDLRGIRRARHLQFLDLSSNNLLTLDLEIFRRNPKLEVLILNDNPDIHIYGNIPRLHLLKTLAVQNCDLTKIPWEDFRTTPSLRVLDLLGNSIEDVSAKVVQSLPEAVELVVDYELCSLLGNRDDVKRKKIKLTCGKPSEHSEPFLGKTEEPKVEQKEEEGGLGCVVKSVLIIGVVILLTGVSLILSLRKKPRIRENPSCGEAGLPLQQNV